MSDREAEKGATGPLGMKRTSKHKKKLADRRGAHQCRVVLSPRAIVRDVRVGGVNAEYSAHGRGVAEDAEDEGMRKGEDEGRTDDKGRGRRKRMKEEDYTRGEDVESLSFYRPEGEVCNVNYHNGQ